MLNVDIQCFWPTKTPYSVADLQRHHSVLLTYEDTLSVLLTYKDTLSALLTYKDTHSMLLTYKDTHSVLLTYKDTHAVLLTYKDTHSVLLIQESSNRECFAYRINNETILVQCWSNPATDVDRHRHCAWVAPVTNHSLVINMKVYTVYELCTSCASDPSISGNRRGWHRHRVLTGCVSPVPLTSPSLARNHVRI